jgi:PAS domain-containing protein
MPLATHLLRSSPGCCIDMTFDNLSNSPRSGVQDAPWTFDERAAAELERLAQGVIVADEAGRLVFANAAAVAIHGRLIMGVQPDDYSLMHGLFTEDGRPYPSTDLALARAVLFGETTIDTRWRIRRPDASSVVAMGDAMPLIDDRGVQIGAILLFRVVDP